MSDPGSHPDDLLPWYANGTLAGEERARVERHLESCARCRQELKLLSAVRRSVQQETEAATPGELGLRRLMRQVKSETATARTWWRPALATAATVIVAQAIVLAAVLWPREEPITPLGARFESPAAILQVRFAPSATEPEIRAAINAVDGVLVDGPGALGIYRIRLAGVTARDAAAKARAAETLRARSKVVQEVTPE